MYMYEVFPGSIYQEENWKDSVHNHNNEQVVFGQYQCTLCGDNQRLPHSN